MEPVKDVDEYIALAPVEARARLKELRATIMAAAANAQERISYGMPFYEYKGRLIYFQLWKEHIGLYGLSTPTLEQHERELRGYVTSKGTVRLPLAEELPTALIKSLVEAQAKNNEETAKRK
jgi:uncharacterized protein YdhG (YjbR/CyaY superfamily)